MKRKVLIPINRESEKLTADEIIAEAFGSVGTGKVHVAHFTFYWQESETVLEVVNKLDFVATIEEAEVTADYIRRRIGVPLKELPRERNY
jgi:hypothetical protein